MHGVDLTVMHLVRRHEADPGMVMVLVVPVKEAKSITKQAMAQALRTSRSQVDRLLDPENASIYQSSVT
jgi:hypothetical protein